MFEVFERFMTGFRDLMWQKISVKLSPINDGVFELLVKFLAKLILLFWKFLFKKNQIMSQEPIILSNKRTNRSLERKAKPFSFANDRRNKFFDFLLMKLYILWT